MDQRFSSPCHSVSSSATVQHHQVRNISTSSLSSIGSLLDRRNIGDTTPRSSSTLSLSLLTARRTSSSFAFPPRQQPDTGSVAEFRSLRLIDVAESAYEARPGTGNTSTLEAVFDERGLEDYPTAPLPEADGLEDPPASPEPQAFRRWVSKLRRKKMHKPVPVTPRTQRWSLDDFEAKPTSPQKQRLPRHSKQASYNSSIAFVTAVRSATATLASASMPTVSRRNSKWRRTHQRSSLFSGSDPRPSVETQRSIVDEAAKQRSRKRREKVDELIRTEEGYVADLKALSNALYTLLGYRADSRSGARTRAARTLAHLISLHTDILTHLREVVPFAECEHQPKPVKGHTRWYSVDAALPTRKAFNSIRNGRLSLNPNRSSDEDSALELLCDPNVMAAVAAVLRDRMTLFSEYVQFGGYYELMRVDIEQTQQDIASWPEYDSAIETLAYAINPVQSRDANRRKALTVKDLLIKPIQRLPRYELLFSDLCKLTPVCDGPDCHAALERVLHQINHACHVMNRAKDDQSSFRALETTWLIGERLTFSGQVPRSVFLQLLGQVRLCGCLHIAYRSKDRIRGFYVICILLETTLLLASAHDDQQRYSTLAGLSLANTTIAECDNLKGLQCHTAPHSWKLIFEHSARMYEIIFTACSASEKDAWLTRIATGIGTQSRAVAEGTMNSFELHSPIVSEMRSIGKAFGKPGSFVRRMSVHRTATVGPTTDLNQVIIKNTQAVKEALENSSMASFPIGRSQTVAGPSHVQTLTPRRADRVRLEALLADVWTKDLLPYPGMTARRTDEIRASANHVMRKFSMASIASNFSTTRQRNASYTSMEHVRKEDIPPSESSRASSRRPRKYSRPPLVDFHNAPEAFLPEDFELRDPAKRKKSAFRTFTMTRERPFSPLMSENKPGVLQRAQSVRGVPAGSGGASKENESVYSVVQRAADEELVQTPRKSRSKSLLLRMFA
ncbi:hypothetical protein LTR36_010401 [Oleoguttula mirabilis]|uniref:DH domain-containing protein n=1 Tax=Oleoguttula mirabilis TaxID=1507867 RepID=A0AAV9J4C2_9PEZI|nr:hypothetical protein LTR36_010401 [Oleoguttula mirabilis]